ncbi:hypothetical protein HGH92_29330 [Chitinophaga varians]|uniref:Aromatic ring-opening dioxygenase LigA n=1 Tax=Chitinophaga varians TaxID=2202339 RepID=A0A847S0F2_9BACT|nr:hypothetical protein [Chitinophaga varians]NLR68446.1 hypothetical protein [Chitinophaga varians]
MTDIRLNLINRSNDRNNSSIVIFQRNEATSFNELAVAWQVVRNLGQGWNHPFSYPMEMSVSASDSWGNYSPLKAAENGQQFQVVRDPSGDILKYAGQATSQNEVEILNALDLGAVNANVYRDGKLLATKTAIAPGQKATFQFRPTIWIGVVSQVVEGQLINSAILQQINTELSLFGIASADIVMTGGGPGASSTPFEFTLQNILYA